VGVTFIVYYAPANYRQLQLPAREQIIGFCGCTHDIIIVSDGPTTAERKRWTPVAGSISGILGRQQKLLSQLVLVNGTKRRRPLGRAVQLWNLDDGVKNKIDIKGSPEIDQVMPCADGSRLFVHYSPEQIPNTNDIGGQIAVFDVRTCVHLRTIACRSPSSLFGLLGTSKDGKIVVYYSGYQLGIRGFNVDTGREFEVKDATDAVLSPSGRYLASSSFWPGWRLEDLHTHAQKNLSDLAVDFIFSPRSDKLIASGKVWDTGLAKVVREVPRKCFRCIFVNDGKELAWTQCLDNGVRVNFRHLETGRDSSDCGIWIPEWPGGIEAVDSEANLIRLQASGPGKLTWIQKAIDWLGFKQEAPEEGSRQWLLIDVKSRRVVDQGRDELIAVSADGRYVVSGERDQNRLKLQELPLHRSTSFMAVTGAVWTLLLLVCRRWWRRRLKPL
jgi:hypothetical protein